MKYTLQIYCVVLICRVRRYEILDNLLIDWWRRTLRPDFLYHIYMEYAVFGKRLSFDKTRFQPPIPKRDSLSHSNLTNNGR
jgi:hypothetical protein